MALTEIDLTEGRNALNRTGHEISQAAKYCSSNYLKANGQRRVIDETMNYATQSLGTMIHHINNLATTFLTLLDEKTEKMSNVEESVNQLSMEIKIRREKVARKAIGSCTISKVPVKCTLTKVRQEAPVEYVRRPIDYTLLDHIGHGHKTQEPVASSYSVQQGMHARTLTRRGSSSVQQVGMLHGNTIDPKTMGAKPISNEYAAASASVAGTGPGGTLGRTAGIYRAGGMVSQYSNPYGGQQSVAALQQGHHTMVPNTRGGPGYGSTSTPIPSASQGNGPSNRSSLASSGSHPRGGSGYAPTGAHLAMAQQQQPVQQAASSMGVGGYASKQQMFTGGALRSPVRGDHPPPSMADLMRQHSNTSGDGAAIPPQVHHNYPPTAVAGGGPVQPPLDVNKMSCGHGDLPPPPSPMEMVNRRAVSQTNTGASMPPSASSVETNNSGVDISRLQPDPVMDQLRPRQSGDPAWAPHHYIQKVVTVYEYTADKSDELSFSENELIFVIKKNDDGWWEGVMMNGQTGLFPGNYVEPIE